jgi:SulP family sulfate permease
VLSRVLDFPVETIGSRFGAIPRTLPGFELPEFSWETAKQLLIPTLTIAMLGAIESLLCARVADNLTDYPRHDPNQELMAQGVANFVVPFFGGIPATGTIARTVTNVRAGATSPVAGLVHAAALLVIVLAAAPLAAYVPLAVLAGILLHVAWNMGEWHEFARLRHFGVPYRATLLGTFVMTVVFDLTVAVEVGLLLACGFFIWRMGTLFEARTEPSGIDGVQVYRLFGPLFFGAAEKIEAIGSDLPAGTRAVVLEMHRLISLDNTGLEALRQLARALAGRGVQLLLCDLNEQPRGLVEGAGFDGVLGAGGLQPDLAAALRAVSASSRSAAP